MFPLSKPGGLAGALPHLGGGSGKVILLEIKPSSWKNFWLCFTVTTPHLPNRTVTIWCSPREKAHESAERSPPGPLLGTLPCRPCADLVHDPASLDTAAGCWLALWCTTYLGFSCILITNGSKKSHGFPIFLAFPWKTRLTTSKLFKCQNQNWKFQSKFKIWVSSAR